MKATVIGTGFMGKVHTEALRRLGSVEVKTVVSSAMDWRQAVSDPEIDAVHICTPNALHYPMLRLPSKLASMCCARSR